MAYRAEWVAFAQNFEEPLAVTLASNQSISLQAMSLCVDDFFNRVERNALGAQWHRKPQSKRLKAVGFFEHLDSNIHVHLAVEAPDRLSSVLINAEAIWRKVRPGGSYHCDLMGGGWATYITKDFWGRGAEERSYVRAGRV